MTKTVTENSALLHDASKGRISSVLLAAVWGVSVLAASSSMVNMNKYMMQDSVFPYPVPMVLFQFSFATMLNGGLIMIRPGLYPSLTGNSESKVIITRELMLRRVLPVAFAFVISVLASNMAYYYSSVPFLQMMKESNIITVYVMSLAIGAESFDSKQSLVLVLLAIATVGSIHGEVRFSLAGFVLQAVACLGDASKNIISAMLLSGAGKKLDPMSFSLLLSPLVLGFTGLLCVGQHQVQGMTSLPSQQAFERSWQLLLGNAVLAFGLNLAIAMFLRYSSALSFGMLGILKDILVVISSTALLGAHISGVQTVSFTMQIVLLCIWTYMKMTE
eukprot:TRINITY_DN12352_c0_g1_i2.p1 TRINITY_DN12352_c0_g1~~TRINITY_DN12352_c0_g1_i2.p1  ORF type:complete len:332 (+),score=60.93 TRINITY_DN12352_c0_g1_i2:89-1084(+)